MKNITFISILITLMVIVSFSSRAQNFQGKAYYISKSKVNTNFGGRQIPEAQKAKIKERQNALSIKNYVLAFNKTSSLFTEQEETNMPTKQQNERGGRMRLMLNTQNSGTHYKNIETKQYVAQKDVFGKQFLIKDSLQNYNWQLSDEVKTIGKYICFKATAIIPKITTKPSENLEDNITTVTAWYTVEIPISQGPDMFWGLPGLILELKVDNRILLCSKIELNLEEELIITPPEKGKKVTQEKFNEIFAKKAKKLKESMGNRKFGGRRKGN